MSVALDAIKKICAKDRAAVLTAVFATKNYSGVLGTLVVQRQGRHRLEGHGRQRVAKGKWEKSGRSEVPVISRP